MMPNWNSQSNARTEGTANAAVESESEEEGAWSAMDLGAGFDSDVDSGEDFAFSLATNGSESDDTDIDSDDLPELLPYNGSSDMDSDEDDYDNEDDSDEDIRRPHLATYHALLSTYHGDTHLMFEESDELSDSDSDMDISEADVEEEGEDWAEGDVAMWEELLSAIPNTEVNEGAENIATEEVAAIAVDVGDEHAVRRKELYDSGCSRHISPFRDDFVTFKSIHPHTFSAANKNIFTATGKGTLMVDVPNEEGTTNLRLVDVMYSTEVAYTMVSIGRLDQAGYSTTFTKGKCIIRDADNVQIGVIPKSKAGLYRVVHEFGESDGANAADEAVTVTELHARMGHIARTTAKKLVGAVTGLELVKGDEKEFCDTCEFGKATRKVVNKEKMSEEERQRAWPRATQFADKIHSDVWQ